MSNKKTYLRILLDSKGVKPSDLAKIMGITTATMNRKIQGKIKFSEKDIKIVLDELNMSYEEVFGNKYSLVVINDKSFVVSKTTESELISIIEKEVS